MVHFTVPEEYDSSWYIQISGRLETEGGGMSVHYLDEESEADINLLDYIPKD